MLLKHCWPWAIGVSDASSSWMIWSGLTPSVSSQMCQGLLKDQQWGHCVRDLIWIVAVDTSSLRLWVWVGLGASRNQISRVCNYVLLALQFIIVSCSASMPTLLNTLMLHRDHYCHLQYPCSVSKVYIRSRTLVNYAIKALLALGHRCVGCIDQLNDLK